MKIRSINAIISCLAAASLSQAAALGATNWPQFRGPQAAGISASTTLPDKWSATENVAWKTDLQGRSWSSPIVWGDRVFLTAVVNQGDS
jgi:outer membrane protein assembly factor BamB